MIFRVFAVLACVLGLSACSGGGASGSRDADSRADANSVIENIPGELAELPPGGPAAAAPDSPAAPSGTLALSGIPVSRVAPTGLEGIALTVTTEPSYQEKGCKVKYDACIAATPADANAVEYQRACNFNFNQCKDAKSAEVQCMDKYDACVAAIPDDAYKIEAQRACLKNKDICLANEVYPACCQTRYDACTAAIASDPDKAEKQRGCARLMTGCTDRFYCEES